MSIKSKAVGLDGIPIAFLKIIFPDILPQVTHILNYSIMSSTFPNAWKLSKVLPTHKKGKFFNLEDFRPIHILPVLSKLFEILLSLQVQNFISLRRLQIPFQSAFRPAHSTTSALLKITHDISRALDKKLVAILLLLDFSKAFDSVNHHLLCTKLCVQFFFDVSAVKLIASYLSTRMQAVEIDGVISTLQPVNQGVPQGSVLGPLLFALFINDLPNSIKYMFSHLYADDAQLYKFFSSVDAAANIELVNRDLHAVADWARSNKLILNAAKSKAIIIGARCLKDPPTVQLNGVVIPYFSSVKNLGLIFNERLTWSDHVVKVSQRIFIGLRNLWPMSKSTPLRTRILLARSLLMPHLEYCSEIFFYGLDAESLKVLVDSVKSVVRYVYGLGRYDSTDLYVNRFLGCSLETYLRVRSLCFIYKVDCLGEPAYLKELLIPGHSSRLVQLSVPRFDLALGKRSLLVQGVIDWNSLPLNIRKRSSLNAFKNDCLSFLNRRNNPTVYT